MRINRFQIIGVVLLLVLGLLQVSSDPFHAFKEADDSGRYWYSAQMLPENVHNWKGQDFTFESWVYHYIPPAHLSGKFYRHADFPGAVIEGNLVQSRVKDHLHDANLCNYSQGLEQKLIETIPLDGSIRGAFYQMKDTRTGEVFYQLNWYQWGPNAGEDTFKGWFPVASTWLLSHQGLPLWHYFNLTYINPEDSSDAEAAKTQLTAFAKELEKELLK